MNEFTTNTEKEVIEYWSKIPVEAQIVLLKLHMNEFPSVIRNIEEARIFNMGYISAAMGAGVL